MDTDRLFARFVTGLFIILSLFGLGMTVVIIFGDSDVGLRMVNAFASMFVAVLGFGSGYLLGQNRAKSINGKEDTHDGT